MNRLSLDMGGGVRLLLVETTNNNTIFFCVFPIFIFLFFVDFAQKMVNKTTL